MDVVFIAGKPRLFSVDDITGYIVKARMESKGQADVNKAIDAIISRYQSSLKVVSVISCDAEALLKSQSPCRSTIKVSVISCDPEALSSITLRAKVSSLHLVFLTNMRKIAERSMRILRENNHNNLPNSKTTPRTPAEIISGEKFNFFADLQAPFGSVVLVNHSRSNNKANEIGICLDASHRTKGVIWVFAPNVDKEPKVRRRIQGMPMTQEFINFMNTLQRSSFVNKLYRTVRNSTS